MNESDVVIEMLDQNMTETSEVIPVKKKKSGELASSSQTLPQDTFEELTNYAVNKANSLGEEILKGNIEIAPVKDEERKACDFCQYKSICGFDTSIPGYQYRNIDLEQDAAIVRMKQVVHVDEKEIEEGDA